MTKYPWGYGTSERTLEQIELALRNRNYHPEFLRRFIPWLESTGGKIGVGGHWRPNPSDTSAASRAGRSFHQDQKYRDGHFGPCAIDLVARTGPGLKHRSPTWNETPQSGTGRDKVWGLHTFIKNEPWHIQPIEIRGYWTWTTKLRPAPVPNYPIPGDWRPTVPPVTEPVVPPVTPPASNETEKIVQQLPVLRRGASGPDVQRVQALLNVSGATLTEDGQFGPNTHNALVRFQASKDLTQDGIVGRKETWPALLGL